MKQKEVKLRWKHEIHVTCKLNFLKLYLEQTYGLCLSVLHTRWLTTITIEVQITKLIVIEKVSTKISYQIQIRKKNSATNEIIWWMHPMHQMCFDISTVMIALNTHMLHMLKFGLAVLIRWVTKIKIFLFCFLYLIFNLI